MPVDSLCLDTSCYTAPHCKDAACQHICPATAACLFISGGWGACTSPACQSCMGGGSGGCCGRAHIDDVQHEVLARDHGRAVVPADRDNDRVPFPVMRVRVLRACQASPSVRTLPPPACRLGQHGLPWTHPWAHELGCLTRHGLPRISSGAGSSPGPWPQQRGSA